MNPPQGFKPAGLVVQAYLSEPPPFVRKVRYSGARAQGVRYEKKVQAHLQARYGDEYLPSPWLRFLDGEDKWRWCQPDGIVLDVERGRIICVEVKYSHTADAWWQVRRLYLPVLEKIFPTTLWKYEVCEVVRWFDPAVVFPERIQLAAEVGQESKAFRVHICRL